MMMYVGVSILDGPKGLMLVKKLQSYQHMIRVYDLEVLYGICGYLGLDGGSEIVLDWTNRMWTNQFYAKATGELDQGITISTLVDESFVQCVILRQKYMDNMMDSQSCVSIGGWNAISEGQRNNFTSYGRLRLRVLDSYVLGSYECKAMDYRTPQVIKVGMW